VFRVYIPPFEYLAAINNAYESQFQPTQSSIVRLASQDVADMRRADAVQAVNGKRVNSIGQINAGVARSMLLDTYG